MGARKIEYTEANEAVDTKKLDNLAELLLDTGKRNNLINFKDKKDATVEVLFPSPEILFDKIDRSSSWTVFNPQLADADEDDIDEESNDKEQVQFDASEDLAEKEAFLARYSGKLKNKNQILLYNASKNPLVAVKNICKKEQENIEETGVNVVYMTFGFIHWKESESSKIVFRAPILLVPIHLESTTDIGTYRIKND